MQLYEITFLISPDLSEPEAQDFFIEKEKEIGTLSQITSQEQPKRIGLYYPIKKQKSAYLASVKFEAEPEKAIEIKKIIEENTNILRFLIVKAEKELPPRVKSTRKPKPQKETEEMEEMTILAPKEEKPVMEEKKPKPEKEPKLTKKKKEVVPKVSMEEIDQKLDEILNNEPE